MSLYTNGIEGVDSQNPKPKAKKESPATEARQSALALALHKKRGFTKKDIIEASVGAVIGVVVGVGVLKAIGRQKRKS